VQSDAYCDDRVPQALASYFIFGEATQDTLWLTGEEKNQLQSMQ